jgi:hypothetical protein
VTQSETQNANYKDKKKGSNMSTEYRIETVRSSQTLTVPRPRWLALLLTTVCLGSLALAGNVLRGHGSFTGRATVTPLSGTQADLVIQAGGNVTHLGKSTVRLHTVADFSGAVPTPIPPSTGVIRAANGDTVSFTLKWSVTESAPNVFRTTGPFTIVGGTGRFAGASGGGDYDGIVDLNTGGVSAEITGELAR